MKSIIKDMREKSKIKRIKDFVSGHISNIRIDEELKEIDIIIDKRYSLNILNSTSLKEEFVDFLKKMYSPEFDISFHLDNGRRLKSREMQIPHSVHR